MRTWLITGASSGLGRAMAHGALEAGDAVVGFMRDPVAAAAFDALAGERSLGLAVDVTERAAVFDAVARAEALTGAIDILVNNAGQVLQAYVEEADPNAVRALIEVNLMGPLNLIQAVLPHMRARRSGRIFNISSGGGIQGVPSIGLYSASKFALEGMTEALAAEVGPLGIHVVIIEPGAFRTNLLIRNVTTNDAGLADYAAGAGRTRDWIARMGGTEPGDPAKLGRAVVAFADVESPPMRLPLGQDALAMVLAKADSLRSDAQAGRGPSADLAFDV